MNKSRYFLLFLFLGILTGCSSLFFPIYFEDTSTEPIDIEILRPADTIINQSVKKVLVFIKPGLIPRIIIKDGRKNFSDKTILEKLPEAEFHSMADLLSGSPRFDILEPVNALKPPKSNFYNWDEIDSICKSADVDACLFLSSQEILLGLKIAGSYDGEYQPKGIIWLTSTYEFYSRKGHIAITKEVKTGVEFQTEGFDKQTFFESLSELESLLSDYSAENGEKFAGWLAPVWNRDTREYFVSGNKEFESIKELITLEKWDDVFKIWRKYCHDSNIVTAKHASYNTIISYEMEGKLDSALYWARDAYKRFHSEEIVNYGLILEERIRENGLVNTQLGIEEGRSNL